MWSTFNEPWCYAYLGHGSGAHAPGLRDPKAAVTVAHHQLLAHGLAVQAMRAERNGLALGIVINPSNIVSEGVEADEDEMRMIDGIHNRWWFDATLTGAYPADVIDRYGAARRRASNPVTCETIAQPLDWMGINYYFDILVQQAADRGPHMAAVSGGRRHRAVADASGPHRHGVADHARRFHRTARAAA